MPRALQRCSSLFFVFTCVAQAQTQPEFPLDQVRTQCVSIETYSVPVGNDECRVVDFELLTEVDGHSYFYARYQVTAEVEVWPGLRDLMPEANALVLFVREPGASNVRIHQAYHEDFSEFVVYLYPVPEVIATSRGSVLHVIKRGLGGGTQQWFNDEYWLWQTGDWQRLDVASWYRGINSYVPSGYAVDGVAHFDLVDLKAVSAVRRPADAQCCPSGGIISVSFDWFDLALSIRSTEYDPDADISTLTLNTPVP